MMSEQRIEKLTALVLRKTFAHINRDPKIAEHDLFPWIAVSQVCESLYEKYDHEIDHLDQDWICDLVGKFYEDHIGFRRAEQ